MLNVERAAYPPDQDFLRIRLYRSLTFHWKKYESKIELTLHYIELNEIENVLN